MFVNQLRKKNPALLNTAFELHQTGRVSPDSYIIDVDTFLENARNIAETGKAYGIRLFFMLKQVGRNPYLAKRLVEMGYEGAVTVDYKEAEVMMRHGIPIKNAGHLVQIPGHKVKCFVAYGVEYMTVYTREKIEEIQKAAAELGKIQKILLRVAAGGDMMYSGQTAGFSLEEMKEIALWVEKDCKNVKVAGVTSFPCYLYDSEEKKIRPIHNLKTVLEAASIMEKAGMLCELVNTPSASCCSTLKKMAVYGGNSAEPGHGLTGTTPLHAECDEPEIPCCVYVTEVSHNFENRGYCYGGGYYRRSHVENALVGTGMEKMEQVSVIPPDSDSIDYHFGLSQMCQVGDTVLMAFRFQIFVTRSDVVLVEGLHRGEKKIIGVYDSQGRQKWTKDS